jgi:beta-phosphoglucomutase
MTGTGGVIFDLDGVLMDTDAVHAPAFRAVLAAHGVSAFDYGDVAGMRTDEALMKLLPDLEPADLARCVEEKRALASERLREHAALIDGAVDVVTALAQTRRLCLATSGSRRTVDAFFARSGTRALFHGLLTGDDVAHGKPDPEIYRRAVEVLGTGAANTIVVEDAAAGVRAARGAGLRVIGFARDRSAESLRAAGAFTTVLRLQELLELV